MPDIIIRGAGLAGQVLYRELQNSGIAATLVDVSLFPRDKVCGGVLQKDSWDYLSHLFQLGSPVWIHSMAHFWKRDKIFSQSLDVPMVFAKRLDLDAKMDAQNHSVRSAPVLRESIVVDASGVPSKKGDWIGFQCEVELNSRDGELQMHYGRGVYLGAVACQAQKGHGAFLVKKDFFRNTVDLRERVEEELGVRLAGEIKGTRQIDYSHFSPGLAIGDAKMTTHPFLGFGMKHAILSARLCADFLRLGRPEGYARAHARQFRNQRRISRWGGRIFDSPFQVALKPFFSKAPLFHRAYGWVHGES